VSVACQQKTLHAQDKFYKMRHLCPDCKRLLCKGFAVRVEIKCRCGRLVVIDSSGAHKAV